MALSPWSAAWSGVMVCILMSALMQKQAGAAPPPDGAVTISPYDPNASWQADHELLPDESVRFSVTVEESGNPGGTPYELEGNPDVNYTNPETLWTQTSQSSPYVFRALNTGVTVIQDRVTLSVVWKEQITPSDGEGEPPELGTIDGSADGIVYSEVPVFTWTHDRRVQFANGQSEIHFDVTAAVNGAAFDLTGYTITNDSGWIINSRLLNPPPASIDGTVKSSSAGEGNLKIEKGSVEDTSPEKICFALVESVWSNQINNVEVNGFPDKTGRNNQPYAIMGVRNDGNAHIRIKLQSAISAEFRQKVLFRLRQPQVTKPGSSSFGTDGDVVDVIAESVSDNPEVNHRVYMGYDNDDDGELSAEESSGAVYSTANGQDQIPVEFKIISKNRHEQSRQKNIEFADNGFAGIVPNLAPTGASLIKSFHKALPPNSNTTNATTIDRTGDNRLSHPVGVAFNPTQVPGDAVNGVYNRNHILADNVLKSQPFRKACRDGFNAILPTLIQRRETTGISEDFVTFTWEETVGDPSLNFRLNQNSVPNMPDFDSFLALGKVRVENARIGFRYDLNAQFVEVSFQGTFKDLYDFDYDDSFNLIVWSADEIRQGAETQAGYPTLKTGGKVFTTQLDIRNGEEYIESGYSFFLFK
jgi:hypothetical protein